MRETYLEHRGRTDGTEHCKFYRLVDDGRQVVFSWGPVGATGQRKVIIEPDAQRRTKLFDDQLAAKTSRGYVTITEAEDNRAVMVESRPSDTGRYWGLEVETHSNLDIADVAARMRQRNLNVSVNANRYFKSDGRQWDVKRDGSCGYEFASPKLRGEAGIFDAKIAVEKIHEVCPMAVNSKCGLHVTIDVADHTFTDLRRLVVGYLKAQEHFYGQCNESRQQNTYCLRNPVNLEQAIHCKSSTSDLIAAVDGKNRYHGLNLTRLQELSVVEFRMMESTVAVRKVGSWIRACVGFVDGLKSSNITFVSVTRMSTDTFNKIITSTYKHDECIRKL